MKNSLANVYDPKQIIWGSLKRMQSKSSSQSCKKRKMIRKSELMLSYENLTNEARRDAYKRRSCPKSRKSTHQTDQRDDEKSSFHICWIVAAYSWSRGRVKENQQDMTSVTPSYARNVPFQVRNMFNKLISSSVVSRVMTTSSSRAWRLLLASYDSQSSMTRVLRLSLFRIHSRTWEEIRAKDLSKKRSDRSRRVTSSTRRRVAVDS